MKKQGYNELYSPNDLTKFTEFITNGILARRSVAEKDRDMVHRVIKLTAESIKYIQTNRDGTQKIMAKWMPMKEADIAEELYRFATENYAKEGFTPEGGAAGYDQADGGEQFGRRQSRRGYAGDGLLRQSLR